MKTNLLIVFANALHSLIASPLGGASFPAVTNTNPTPDNEVKSVNFVAKRTSATPFLIAITVE